MGQGLSSCCGDSDAPIVDSDSEDLELDFSLAWCLRISGISNLKKNLTKCANNPIRGVFSLCSGFCKCVIYMCCDLTEDIIYDDSEVSET